MEYDKYPIKVVLELSIGYLGYLGRFFHVCKSC